MRGRDVLYTTLGPRPSAVWLAGQLPKTAISPSIFGMSNVNLGSQKKITAIFFLNITKFCFICCCVKNIRLFFSYIIIIYFYFIFLGWKKSLLLNISKYYFSNNCIYFFWNNLRVKIPPWYNHKYLLSSIKWKIYL